MFLKITEKRNHLALIKVREEGLKFNLSLFNSVENGEMNPANLLRLDVLERPLDSYVRVHWSSRHGPALENYQPPELEALMGIQLSLDVFTGSEDEETAREGRPQVLFYSCEHAGSRLELNGKMLCSKHVRRAGIAHGRHLCMELRLNVCGRGTGWGGFPEALHHHSADLVSELRDLELPLTSLQTSAVVFDAAFSAKACPGCKFHGKRWLYEYSRCSELQDVDR